MASQGKELSWRANLPLGERVGLRFTGFRLKLGLKRALSAWFGASGYKAPTSWTLALGGGSPHQEIVASQEIN